MVNCVPRYHIPHLDLITFPETMNIIRVVTFALLCTPLISKAGFIEDTKAETRRNREEAAIASLGSDYAPEIKKYRENPNREGTRCYVTASANWTMWTGLPKTAFEACDGTVRKEIIAIREADNQALAIAKAERAEKRKGMSEVAAKLDEIDERQQDRERDMDRKEAARQAKADELATAQGKLDSADEKLSAAKRFSCAMGNRRDC
jgi:hypothetical protein